MEWQVTQVYRGTGSDNFLITIENNLIVTEDNVLDFTFWKLGWGISIDEDSIIHPMFSVWIRSYPDNEIVTFSAWLPGDNLIYVPEYPMIGAVNSWLKSMLF
jgi:hypothetical protein